MENPEILENKSKKTEELDVDKQCICGGFLRKAAAYAGKHCTGKEVMHRILWKTNGSMWKSLLISSAGDGGISGASITKVL